jgi:EpsI family protein
LNRVADTHPEGFEQGFSRRELLIGGALLGSTAIAHAGRPGERYDLLGATKLESLIPKNVGEWSFYTQAGLVVPTADELSDQVYADLLTRVYVSKNRLPIMLLVAQSPAQSGVVQVHRPEVCYRFSGYKLSGGKAHMISVPGGPEMRARRLTATKENRIEQLLFWTRVGEKFPESWLQQRMAVAEANFRGIIPDAVLVRISAISPDESAVNELVAFSRALLGAIPPSQRKVLTGLS